ncbi:MAG TPA: N-6 DNA methylase, partial [Vicinamibacterales bacterium]|nr:N-6 DNA methylase [Vicinamibacterales bacterium]
RPARGGARRVSYAELDVEELGSIYERVLDLDPAGEGRARKESGSFYTPRALTEFIARRTLAPLVAGASSRRILSLRVVDPAMGSGAFLVAALRFLASALEAALVREGALPEHDVLEADRQQLRRLVAQRCLYGVDANPTAALLARLSLWLATLSSDRPLGFLDHRLKCGNSLVGTDPKMASRAPGRASARAALPLFDAAAPVTALGGSAARARALARMAEDTLEDVRRKQKRFESLASGAAGITTWRSLCDAWCAWWFVPPSARMDAREYRALADALVRGSHVLSRRGLARRLRQAAASASAERFFHWPLEFPEVFAGGAPGFDAVIGNPPWEMLRAGAGSPSRDRLKAFARGSGAFTLAAGGHLNLYQLFVERSLGLARHGGRIGMVLPWGLMTDDGSAALRAALFDGTHIDTLVRFDNRDGVFQAHRSLRFAALTTTVGEATPAFELTRVPGTSALDDLPDAGGAGRGPMLTRRAMEVLGGRGRRVPDAAGAAQLALALKLAGRHRGLGDPLGWGASFGRELNLTDDRRAFSPAGMPVLEGKHLHPFHVNASGARHHITRAAAARRLPARPFDRPRLAYRDVTAATNRQTLIAAIVPAGMVTSHSLFCLRNGWDRRSQHALCLILNSSVANFLIRLFVSSHVTTSLMAWLPVPDRGSAVEALSALEPGAAADARVRALYGLTKQEAAAI